MYFFFMHVLVQFTRLHVNQFYFYILQITDVGTDTRRFGTESMRGRGGGGGGGTLRISCSVEQLY